LSDDFAARLGAGITDGLKRQFVGRHEVTLVQSEVQQAVKAARQQFEAAREYDNR